MKKRCYYAHSMPSYGSVIEKKDVDFLESLGFEVINPSTADISFGCSEYREKFGNEHIMHYFTDIIDTCDIVAFRALPDGKILSGISAEIQHALKTNKGILELPNSIRARSMNYTDTKEYLLETGFYKI
jgi:hypothetical protein